MRVLKIILYVIYAVVASAFLVFAFFEKYIFETWSELLPDEMLYFLSAPAEGTDKTVIINGLLTYGIGCVIIIAFFVFLHWLVKSNKRALRALVLQTLLSTICMFCISWYDANERSGLVDYAIHMLRYDPNEDFIEQNYVDPHTANITFPVEKRNLIYIYLESMEVTFADEANGGAFKENLIPEITKLSHEYEDFSGDEEIMDGALSLPGTNWTVGAMFGHSSGLPLKLTMGGNDFEGKTRFFPEIRLIGDILKDEGYHNLLLIGSNAVFGGRDALYSSHGDYDIHDYNYMQDTGLLEKGYKVFWGYEDEKLYNYAKEDLLELAAGEEPFNFTMLTVDTHFEDGYFCRLCEDKYKDNQYANVYSCADRQLKEFISWIQEQPFYNNTTIVICGDHTTMDTDFCIDVPKDYERKAVYTVINGAKTNYNSAYRKYSVLDSFPTTLAALGATIEGDKLGLGVNLYSKQLTLAETMGEKELSKALEKPSKFFERYADAGVTEWDLKRIEPLISIDYKRVDDDENRLDIVLTALNGKINASELKNGYIIVNKPDGSTERYDLIVDWYNEVNPHGYLYKAITNLPLEELLDGTEIKAYINVRQIKDYLIAEKTFSQEDYVEEE